MTHRYLMAPVALAAALGFGSVGAQAPAAPAGKAAGTTAQPAGAAREAPAQKQDKLARGDRKFIEEAASHGQFEVQAGRLAAQKGSDQAVKSFGERLVKDHTAANQELRQIATQHQVKLDADLPRSLRNRLQDLEKKTGAEFDREFVKEVGIEAHEDDVKKFKEASKDVKDPQLKAWVDKTLPVLEQHLAQARQLPPAQDAARMGAAPAKEKRAAPAAEKGAAPAAGAKSGS